VKSGDAFVLDTIIPMQTAIQTVLAIAVVGAAVSVENAQAPAAGKQAKQVKKQ
jgi:hypothetical protein